MAAEQSAEVVMNTSPIICDLETSGLPNAADFLDEIPDAVPDESPIETDKRLTDPVKITADFNRKQLARVEQNREAQEKVERMRVERLQQCALDYNLGRVVALGYWTEETGSLVRCCDTEAREAEVIRDFWSECRHRTIVGFNLKAFDMRFLVQRSRYLGIPYPWLDFGKYSRKGVIDLYLDLTFCDGPYDKGPMKRSLKSFCRRFGIPVNDAIDGAEIPQLVAEGKWDQVAAHCRADVELTVQLAHRLGIIREIPMPVEAVL